jgi:hypothetical protein
MAESDIPPNLRTFINEHIRSVVELEVLLLMQQDPARRWTSLDLGRALRIDPGWTERELFDLNRRGLVTKIPGEPPLYHFTDSPPLQAIVSQLQDVYIQRRVSIIQLIFAKPSEPIQSFADAFRLRKDQSDD